MISEQPSQASTATVDGTLDGEGAGDQNLTYRFGRKPSVAAPFPFSTREYVRLLIVRSRVHSAFPFRPPVGGY
jgi:hypothetical protein